MNVVDGLRLGRGHWLLACVLSACGGAARDPLPGSDVVHTPPPNADSLHRVSVQLSFAGGTESGGSVLGLPKKPLGGWQIEARWLGQERVPGGAPDEDLAVEAIQRTDVSGVAVFWLEQPGAYRFSLVEQYPLEPGCWWWGAADVESESAEVLLRLSLACT